jgi:hypothetical protein
MIIIEAQVYKVIDEYTRYLIKEGLTSNARALQKEELIIQALHKNLGGVVTHRFSPYKDLGRDQGCRLYVYTDPKNKKSQWGFGYKADRHGNVVVMYMKHMSLVT